jgi:hypothetical protein
MESITAEQVAEAMLHKMQDRTFSNSLGWDARKTRDTEER